MDAYHRDRFSISLTLLVAHRLAGGHPLLHARVHLCSHENRRRVARQNARENRTIHHRIPHCLYTATMATLIYMPHMVEAIKNRPIFFVVAILNMLAIANIPREIHFGRDARAFASSCVNIILLMILYGIGTFPNVVRAINDPANLSLTIYNSSSSEKTLEILLLIALIGPPYGDFIHHRDLLDLPRQSKVRYNKLLNAG